MAKIKHNEKAKASKKKVKASDLYKGYTLEQIGKVFAKMQSEFYNYPLNNPPKMDRTAHSTSNHPRK